MADFFAPGTVDIFVQFNSATALSPVTISSVGAVELPVLYLGSAISAPEIESSWFYTPVNCDLNSPAPFQMLFGGEQHHIVASLNRLNFNTYNQVRLSSATAVPVTRTYTPGRLQLNSDDFSLILRYWLPANGVAGPAGTASIRQYDSAILIDYRESTVGTRIQEVNFLFQCNALYNVATNNFTLYTEDPAITSLITFPPNE
jgi:hypothetical protein